MPLPEALTSLEGLSVGDAFGAQFFVPGTSPATLTPGPPPWPWTDDTQMACLVTAELRDRGEIVQEHLAAAFAEHCDPYRGYGPGAITILRLLRDGVPWREAATSAFGGGSLGNGAAMRVAPLGAFFADDPAAVVEQATRSAEVTHAHPEGIDGAVAVALAAARPDAVFEAVLDGLRPGAIRDAVALAETLLGRSPEEAVHHLGNGSRPTALTSVPLVLWIAATHAHDYRAAIGACVRAGGDVDTTAAMVGGIVRAPIPPEWLEAREPLPQDLRNSLLPNHTSGS
ncbi:MULTISPECIES: ADP-ribosylglycohydrolase family protein [Actinosynnema]|uniref:ADP-ribosylglycohydrolase family protein n=1 Tax=Actinosynnema TaxID=40566 RepID=UPI0020A50D8B|nr:ADP-ribosylglycohydrolase family protein [Actinosynnema pretiosum]MCP2093204.1 ADP-ribosylglycohydrolase [Actinosynnema pretiosum]